MFGLDYIVFRPHNVYGKRQNLGDRYRNGKRFDVELARNVPASWAR